MNHLRITSAELAKICGVSQGTIDRALNNRADIKAETKQKILKTAKMYGYRENVESVVDNCCKGKIGIIIFNLYNEYFSKLVMEVEKALKNFDFYPIIMMTHYDEKREIECIRNMYNIGVDGIILCAVNSGCEFDNYLNMFDIPIVAVGNDIGGIPYVGIDDFKAMEDMCTKLINDGYTNLIYFSPALNYTNAYAQISRYNGFLSAAQNHTYTVAKDISEIQTEYPANTAIVCSTDYYAFQAYTKTSNVKISGFDNLDAIEKYKFRIDSVDYSIPDIATEAVDIVLNNKTQGRVVPHSIISHS